MVQKVVLYAIGMIFQLLTKEMMAGFIKAGIEKVRELAASTETTTVDDIMVEKASMLLLGALDIEGNTNVSTETDRLMKVLGDVGTDYIKAGLDWLDSYFEEGSFKDDLIELSTSLVRKLIS